MTQRENQFRLLDGRIDRRPRAALSGVTPRPASSRRWPRSVTFGRRSCAGSPSPNPLSLGAVVHARAHGRDGADRRRRGRRPRPGHHRQGDRRGVRGDHQHPAVSRRALRRAQRDHRTDAHRRQLWPPARTGSTTPSSSISADSRSPAAAPSPPTSGRRCRPTRRRSTFAACRSTPRRARCTTSPTTARSIRRRRPSR